MVRDKVYPDTVGEAKVVEITDGKGTSHTVLMTKVDGRGYPPLADKGFRGDHVFYQVVDAGVVAAHYDPRSLVDTAPFVGKNDSSYEFMVSLHDGIIDWDGVPNGSSIGPDELEVMTNG